MPFRRSPRRRGGIDVTLIVHRFEKQRYDAHLAEGRRVPHLVPTLLAELQRRDVVGEVHVAGGPGERRSDVAILHVNASTVDQEHLDFAASFRRCLNATVGDITKRAVGGAPVDDDWRGPVIVKSDLNYRGIPEARINAEARAVGAAEPFPGVVPMDDYVVHDTIDDVSTELLSDPRVVVQRFVPERSGSDYAIRHWVFCGDAGYCYRYVSPHPLIKGGNIVTKEAVEVPDRLAQIRKDLGFDLGKFDFVVHDGEVELFDVNKTPGPIPRASGDAAERVALLADGLERELFGGRL